MSLIIKSLLFVILISIHYKAFAQLNTRSMAMGGTHITSVITRDALFYNPAFLAQASEIEILLYNMDLATNGYQHYEDYQNLNDPNDFDEVLRSLYGDHISFNVGARTQITFLNYALSYYDQLNLELGVDNPVIPELAIDGGNDLGYAAGFGLKGADTFGIGLDIGVTLRKFDRIEISGVYGPSQINSFDPDVLINDSQTKGSAYAIDMGFVYQVKSLVNPTFALMWKNVGNTTFKKSSASIAAPNTQESEMILGTSMSFDVMGLSMTPVFEYRYLNQTGMDNTKKVHIGFEFDLPLLDLQVGYNQGYLTYGFGLDLGIFTLGAASYGVELGKYSGQREDRRYMINMSFDLGFGLDFSYTSKKEREKKRRAAKLKKRR